MGRNDPIKRFDARQSGQPIDLLDARGGTLPAVLELLGTPWIRRASDLPSGDGSGKRAELEVAVEWDGERGAPRAFRYRGKRHRVDAVVMQWAVEHAWWDRSQAVSRRCFRVLARGGVWELAYDRTQENWLLTGIVD